MALQRQLYNNEERMNDNKCFSCPLLFQDTICNFPKDTADHIRSFLKTGENNSRARRKSGILPVLVLHEKETALAKAANRTLVFDRNVRNNRGEMNMQPNARLNQRQVSRD